MKRYRCIDSTEYRFDVHDSERNVAEFPSRAKSIYVQPIYVHTDERGTRGTKRSEHRRTLVDDMDFISRPRKWVTTATTYGGGGGGGGDDDLCARFDYRLNRSTGSFGEHRESAVVIVV